MDIAVFLEGVRTICWFEHIDNPDNNYHVISSVFEAYDAWNAQMLQVWEPQISSLESMAIEKLGDAQTDEVFETVALELGDAIYEKWCSFIETHNLRDEVGLEYEMLDMVKRDISWACIEKLLHKDGFFCRLLEIYKNGYFPCSWSGNYPEGQAVVL